MNIKISVKTIKETKMNILKVLSGAAAFGIFMFSSSAYSLDMNVGHTLTTDSPFHVGAQKFADILKDKSNGEINITVFPHSQLGGANHDTRCCRWHDRSAYHRSANLE